MIAIVFVFLITYTLIALEHPLRINKSATALIAAGLMWTLYATAAASNALPSAPHGLESVLEQLKENLSETAAIVFFLISAMTIVEVTDAHGGFDVITDRIRSTKLSGLLLVIAFITFFMSSILDNMTTTIVMVTLMRKLLKHHEQRLLFAGIIVIAANAGGAWTPIGDVTTTMLWIGGQVTTLAIVKSLFLPSLVNVAVPVVVASFFLKGEVEPPELAEHHHGQVTSNFEKRLMFGLGMAALLFVPIFKSLTHLPPYLGILASLGVFWFCGELLHRNKPEPVKEPLALTQALKRIDMASVVFFIGILLAVGSMSANGQLPALARQLSEIVGDQGVIVVAIGLVSAVVDNIPLVAATMGMYPLTDYPPDSFVWEFLAYCAGTGGSILVIGSAAGVAAMGIEKIQFLWYAKKIGPLALLGYFAGVVAYLMQYALMH
jgi:Na+/H+ antiporter NhaD/arsenite permease-like protein